MGLSCYYITITFCVPFKECQALWQDSCFLPGLHPWGGEGHWLSASQIQREVCLPTHLPHSHSLLLLYQLLAFLSFLTTSTHPSSWRKLPRRKQNCTEHPLIVATEACIYWTIMWSSQKLNRQGIVKWWSHTFNDWFDIDPWLGNIPWRREWLSGPLFLPGEFHGQRSLVGYNPRVRKRDRHDGATNTFTTLLFWHSYQPDENDMEAAVEPRIRGTHHAGHHLLTANVWNFHQLEQNYFNV